MTTPKWISPLFWIAAWYDGVLGLMFLAAPSAIFDRFAEIKVPFRWAEEPPADLAFGMRIPLRDGVELTNLDQPLFDLRTGRLDSVVGYAAAVDLLDDPAFDHLITGRSAFNDLPEVMRRVATGETAAICHVIDYDGE